ncbi:MAG TPA: phage terminase large subunit family protein, partial [Candidatus Olsenella pullicola]|nr:phage terminase large subunit family protein [Candidatus Olsenella pullicola]
MRTVAAPRIDRVGRHPEVRARPRCSWAPKRSEGAYIELKFAQLKWPSQEEEPDLIQRARRVRYVCQECGCILTDRDKPAMLRAGRWQFVRRDSETPRSVAFWMNTLYSPFTTFEEVAREFLKVKDDPEMLHNFVNSWLAEPWEDIRSPCLFRVLRHHGL